MNHSAAIACAERGTEPKSESHPNAASRGASGDYAAAMTDAQPGSGRGGRQIAVGSWVRVYPGTDRERLGRVVEDFGDTAGHRVQVGKHQIVDAARRWAVQLADGGLVFVDDGDLDVG